MLADAIHGSHDRSFSCLDARRSGADGKGRPRHLKIENLFSKPGECRHARPNRRRYGVTRRVITCSNLLIVRASTTQAPLKLILKARSIAMLQTALARCSTLPIETAECRSTLRAIESPTAVHPPTDHLVGKASQVPLVISGGYTPPLPDDLPDRLGTLLLMGARKLQRTSPPVLRSSTSEGAAIIAKLRPRFPAGLSPLCCFPAQVAALHRL
jgi:hypothetical protein